MPTYSELEERLRARAGGSESSVAAYIVPHPPEFQSLIPQEVSDEPPVFPEVTGRSFAHIRLTAVQKLILQLGVTGFRRGGGFKWVCEQGEVKRDYLLLRRHGLIRSVRLCMSLAVAFATHEGRQAPDEDADRF